MTISRSALAGSVCALAVALSSGTAYAQHHGHGGHHGHSHGGNYGHGHYGHNHYGHDHYGHNHYGYDGYGYGDSYGYGYANYAYAPSYGDIVILGCDQADLAFTLDCNSGSWERRVSAGGTYKFSDDRAWSIAFHRGGRHGDARYRLAPGVYRFSPGPAGWELAKL